MKANKIYLHGKPLEWNKTTKDGYEFRLFWEERYDAENRTYVKEIKVIAGCRYLTVKEAEKHWTQPIWWWVGHPEEANYNYDDEVQYNYEAKKRERLNQERLNFIAQGVNWLEGRK